ncbi:MAG TPA: DUF433 domain-containing protein [Longimicrobium sp.]|nr:DUF433 domain-containing protein [Longimicrobium sp.]
MPRFSLYGGRDPRTLPAYGLAEAARYLHIPPATLRSWLVGRTYPRQDGVGSFEPLIKPTGKGVLRLSFVNLVEAHVLRALRTQHGIPISHVRQALDYAERELGIQRLLLSAELLTSAGELFLEQYGQLINLSRSGQLAIKKVLEAHLRRVERDDRALPIRLYPFLSTGEEDGRRPVVIDPCVSFGRPMLAGAGVTTAAIAQRIDAGESVADLALDYGITPGQVEEAVVFENAA